ncbi:hypothetical protein ADK67_04360 [Saccharothrix sp. NRRL B-16348]|uniref:AfsR/SARP family transcriptional regulator n=1 Tax=Saccharothrix sp. NRRL B-16348 TaxID=1415542 RepID=UPI0006B014B6|nr:BTAD domain-containing putative transcriptional regulator [Saccharothrix sp. NRRL B-16348]KOX34188.1 hypothetical protein ADK67_04360 [Saccharothrix sp. NRRL B-16348]
MGGVRFRLLGEVRVLTPGTPVVIRHARVRCVLAALLVDVNRVVPADTLADRVWGEQLPLKPRDAIYNYVSRLRQALVDVPGATLGKRSGGYVVDLDPRAVDLHRFRDLVTPDGDDEARAERLGAALGLVTGEPLTGVDSPWAARVRESLETELLAARLDEHEVRLRLGQHVRLVPSLTALAAAHPLDERIARLLLLALAESGLHAEALAHYDVLRRRLADELGVDPDPDVREVYQRLLEDRPAPARRPAGPVPRQLPAAPGPFVGRHDELDRLDAALRAGAATVVISAIAGTGGIGKSWLALHWAHRNADRFPDGQLFVDLRGFSPDSDPMEPAVAVRGFLDALGVEPGRVPAEPHAQVALFRSLVAGKRMLLVLDNAASTAQITSLLPGSDTCAVVVTSRSRLAGLVTGHGARHVPVDTLADADARGLLTARLGAARVDAEPAATDELIRLCAGFPLALSIIAGRAHTHPHLSLAALAGELRDSALDALDDTDPAASLPAVLSSSHRALTDEQAEVFGLLAMAPGPDSCLAAASSLIGVPPSRARTVLRGLEQASLVNQDVNGRYRMHDLVRRYATDRELPADTRQAALRRVLDFYVHTAYAADLLLEQHRPAIELDPPADGVRPEPLPDLPAAMAWFDAEHVTLRAAQRTAADHGLHRTAWQLAWTLNTFQYRRGHRHDQLAVWQVAVAAAGHLTDPVSHVLAHRLFGRAHAELGRHEEAIGHTRQALALAERHQDPVQQAHAHYTLASALERQGDDRRALEHACRALAFYRTLDQPVWTGNALNAVGWYTARLGDHDGGRAHCEAALTLYREHQDVGGVAQTLDSLGYIDHHSGHHRRAVERYREAVRLYHDLGNTYETAETLDRLGHAHTALGERERAGAVWRDAVELYRRLGHGQKADEVVKNIRREAGAG